MTVQQIIHACGGAMKVASASRRTTTPVTFAAVFKWYRNGIPETHWPLVIGLSGQSVEEIYNANRTAEKRRKTRRKSRARRRPEQRAAA